MHDKSWMTALPTDNFEVRSLLFQHNDRVRRGNNNNNNEYNREFGVGNAGGGGGGGGGPPYLPSFKFGGNGLSRFKNQRKAGAYTGAVQLLLLLEAAAQPNNMRAITIADRSGSLKVMVVERIRQGLQKMLADTGSDDSSTSSSLVSSSSSVKAFDSSRRFLATIRMFDSDGGENHFVLTNLAPIDQ